MTTPNPPYKVTKAPTAVQPRVRLLIPCQFVGGPLDGITRKVEADEHRLPPPVFTGTWSEDLKAPRMGTYRNLPGTQTYHWK